MEKNFENYLRVSDVLYPFSGLQNIDQQVVANAAERGTKVHKICESIIAGLGEFGVDEQTAPYVESFKKWWSTGHKVVSMEERFWDDELGITGQMDLIVNTDDGLAIIDLKTSYKPSKTWPVQGNAYAMLAKNAGYDIKKIEFLHLKKDGSTAKIYNYPIDEKLFLSVLTTYKHFFHKERRK